MGKIIAISRKSGIDIFWVAADGTIWSSNNYREGRWEPRYPVTTANVVDPNNSEVAAVSRRPETIDIFWVGKDGAIWNNWRDNTKKNWLDGMYGSGRRITSTNVADPKHTKIATVSRRSVSVDIFWVGKNDGAVWGNHWHYEPFIYEKDWIDNKNGGEYKISETASADISSCIVAISRESQIVDVFWIGKQGSIWSNFWYKPYSSDGKVWLDNKRGGAYRLLPDGMAHEQAAIITFTPTPELIYAFWIGNDNAIRAVWMKWDKNKYTRSEIIAWPEIGKVKSKTSLAYYLPPNSTKVWLFWQGEDGAIYTCDWDYNRHLKGEQKRLVEKGEGNNEISFCVLPCQNTTQVSLLCYASNGNVWEKRFTGTKVEKRKRPIHLETIFENNFSRIKLEDINLTQETDFNHIIEMLDRYKARIVEQSTSLEVIFINNRFHQSTNTKILRSFSAYNNIKNFTFKEQRVTDSDCEIIAEVLKVNASCIEVLDLSYNQITYTGARRIADAAQCCKALREINLMGNRITAEKKLFEILKNEFLHSSKLQLVHIGQNFISDEDVLKSFNHDNVSGFYRFNFFTTRENVIRSLLSKTLTITLQHAVVSLVCKKDTEHAMIYLETMNKSGQRLLERFHIKASGIIDMATVRFDEPSLKFFDKNEYYIAARSITMISANILRDNIKITKEQHPSFSKYISVGSNRVNCTQWCLACLAEIDVKLDRALFGLPSATVTANQETPPQCKVQ